MQGNGVLCEWQRRGEGRGDSGSPGLCRITDLLFGLKKKSKGKKKEGNERETRKESHLQTKTYQGKKVKCQNQNQTKDNHQLKYTKYTFTKGGKHGVPVYFLGDLVIQANMAKPPQNPKEQHTGEPRVGEGARTFWVERNTTAIWRNAARYCGCKVDRFFPELYTHSVSCYTPACSMLKETSGCL